MRRPAPLEPSREGRVIVGEVRRPWGLEGALAITPFSENRQAFSPGDRVFIDGRPVVVVETYPAGRGAVVMRVDAITTPEQAARLRGAAVEVEAADLPVPPEGVFYHYQLLGARVQTRAGEELGRIVEIVTTGANDVYVVRSDDPDVKDILIPAIRDVVDDVDVATKTVTVDLPEGLR